MKRFSLTAPLAALALAATLLLPALPAAAHDFATGDLAIGHPWTRATPPTAKVGGGYLTIENKGDEADRLIGVTVAFAGRAEMHTMSMEGEVMKMRPLPEGIEIPAQSTVTLAPGGLHIMFMELGGPIVEGNPLPGTLIFEKAGEVQVEFAVEPLGAESSGGGHGHDSHGSQSHGSGGHGS